MYVSTKPNDMKARRISRLRLMSAPVMTPAAEEEVTDIEVLLLVLGLLPGSPAWLLGIDRVTLSLLGTGRLNPVFVVVQGTERVVVLLLRTWVGSVALQGMTEMSLLESVALLLPELVVLPWLLVAARPSLQALAAVWLLGVVAMLLLKGLTLALR